MRPVRLNLSARLISHATMFFSHKTKQHQPFISQKKIISRTADIIKIWLNWKTRERLPKRVRQTWRAKQPNAFEILT
jgi:hypothetical protein